MCDNLNTVCPSFSKLRGQLAQALSEAGTQRQLFSCLVIAVCGVVVLVHLPALSSQALMYDDEYYVTRNPLVQNPSWSSARRFFAEVWQPSTVAGYYHPLAMVSLMTDRFLAGRYENMRTYHRTSLALHVANTALVAIFLYLLFPHPFIAAGVALLFGLHPINVDSVCWLSERKTVLASFFALWSLIEYVKFTRERKVRFYIGCIAAYSLAMLSKPIALPLPLAMVLIDYWPLDRLRWRGIVEKLPLFTVASIFGVVGYISQLHSGSIELPGQYNPLQLPFLLSHNIFFYFCKVLWPTNMSPHYEPVDCLALSSPTMMVSVIGTCALIGGAIISLRWTRAIAMGCLIAFVMLLPASGIISHTIVIVANRYLYLPFIGILLLLAWLLRSPGRLPWRGLAIAFLIIVLAGAESVATRVYLRCWTDTTTLHEYMLSLFPNSAPLHTNFGVILESEGKGPEAVEHYQAALKANPVFSLAHYNLAVALNQLGGHDREVVRHYRRISQLKPSFVQAHMNLGLVLFRMGNSCDGLASLRKAVELAPESSLACYNLGNLLVIVGQPEEGLSHLRKAMAINPRFVQARRSLAWFLATHPDSRIRDANEAVRLGERARMMTKDGDPSVLDTLAAAYASAGQYPKAVETAQKALAVATRLRADKLAAEIEARARLYENNTPYYEDPRVQFEKVLAEAQKDISKPIGREAEKQSFQEAQDEAATIVAE
jgi:tetratricopeptide (TPR) repeat protein